MNYIHRVYIDFGKPVHHFFKPLEHVIENEEVTLNWFALRPDLLAAYLVAPPVDRIEQTLGQVGACAKELHLFAHQHRRYTTGNGPVVTPGAAHNLIAFELNRAGVDRDLGPKTTERIRHSRRIPDGHVWFRRRTEVVKRLQVPEAALRHQRPAIVAHTSDRLGYPGGIPRKQVIIFGCAEKADDAEFDDKVVDYFLHLFFS